MVCERWGMKEAEFWEASYTEQVRWLAWERVRQGMEE